MANGNQKDNQKGASAESLELSDRFYLPNLCTTQSLLFIVLAGTLLAIVFSLVQDGLQSISWESFSFTALFVLWIVLVSVAALCRIRPWLSSLGLMAGSLFSYGLILVVTLVFSLMGQWVLVNYFNQVQGFDGWAVAEQVIIAAILAGVSLRYLFLQEQLHIQQRAELSSRIQALQSRIRPHFLFNSMNIIASLIESDPELAEQVVEDLSDLFRASLSDANQIVPVKQEIDLGKNYLHIEGLRLGERLNVNWDVDEEILDRENQVQLPHLCLQPLLENAVYHGIQPLPEGGTITISMKKHEGGLHLLVRNPMPQNTGSFVSKKGNRMALENLRRRVTAYYGKTAAFQAGVVGDHFEVSVQCPLTPPAVTD